jgi:hypothetical protein
VREGHAQVYATAGLVLRLHPHTLFLEWPATRNEGQGWGHIKAIFLAFLLHPTSPVPSASPAHHTIQ